MSWPARRSPICARAVSPVSGVAVVPRTRVTLAKDGVVEYSTVRRDGRSACAQIIAPSRPVGPAATPASMIGRARSEVTMPGAWRMIARPPSWCKNARLEDVLEAKLNDAPIFRRRDLSERRRAERAVGLSETRLVQDVEAFDAHLHAMTRGEVEVLEDRQVGALEPGTADRVAARV